MEPVVSGQLGMKSSCQQIALAGGNDAAVRKPGQHFYVRAHAFDKRCADKDRMNTSGCFPP